MEIFKIGDKVRATTDIIRKDKTAILRKGEMATVIRTWRTTPESPQIIDIETSNRSRIIDIVCLDPTPIKLIM